MISYDYLIKSMKIMNFDCMVSGSIGASLIIQVQ